MENLNRIEESLKEYYDLCDHVNRNRRDVKVERELKQLIKFLGGMNRLERIYKLIKGDSG